MRRSARSIWSKRPSLAWAFSTTTLVVEPVAFTPGLLNELFDGSGAVWKDADW